MFSGVKNKDKVVIPRDLLLTFRLLIVPKKTNEEQTKGTGNRNRVIVVNQGQRSMKVMKVLVEIKREINMVVVY